MKRFNQETRKICVVLSDIPLLSNALDPRKRLPSIVSRVTLAFGGLVLLGGVSGANWGLARLQAEIVPRLTETLSQALARPIQLGAVEQVSWTGIRLGRSFIPATATDADTMTVEAIEVQFDPVEALKHHQLKLNLTLVRPTVYIDQDKTGEWLNLHLEFDEDAAIELDQLRFRDATITLAPQPIVLDDDPPDPEDEPWDISDHPTQITFRKVTGGLSLREQGEHLLFQVAGQPHDRGVMKLQGDFQFAAKQMKLAVQTQNLQLKSLAALIPTDLKVEAGMLNADVILQMRPDRSISASGKATLADGAMRAKGEPNPFTGIGGQFRFQGQEVKLQQGQLRFGQIPFQLDGNIHFQRGFDLNARVPFVDAAPFMQTLELEVPFPVAGALKSDDLRLTGPFDRPVLSGTALAAKPIQFDRLKMAAVKGEFSLDLADDYLQLHQIQLQPVTGGTITTRAEIWLEPDNAKINVAVKQLPADQLARLYQIGLADDRQLGLINAQVQVNVLHDEPTLTAHWQLDQGDYPAAGQVSLDRDILKIADTAVQIGEGSLQASAELNQGQWQAWLTGSQIPIDRLPVDLPAPLQGELQGELQIAGDLDRGIDGVQAKGETQIAMGEGNLSANLIAQQGRWQAQLVGSQIPLQQVIPDLPVIGSQSTLAGEVNLDGRLAALNLTETKADGKLQLTDGLGWLNQPIAANFAWTGNQLQLKQVETQNIAIAGQITPVLQNQQMIDLGILDLKVRIQDYDLASLPMVASSPLAVTGMINLEGQVTGTVEQPQVDSTLQIDRLAIQDFQFAPLKGKVQSQPDRHIKLDLQGQGDQIALQLDPTYRPTAFSVRWQQAEAAGQWIGNLLSAQIRNFDLAKLNLDPAASLKLGKLKGILAGTLEANLSDFTQLQTTATLEIQQPGLGVINGNPSPDHQTDRAVGTIQYREGNIALTDAELRLGKSHYQMAGQMNTQTSQWQSQIVVSQGNFQDLVTLVPAEEWPQLLQKFSHSSPSQSEPAAPLLSNLTSLQGQFSGQARFNAVPSGMQAAFNVQGQNWQFANYGIQQIAITNAAFDGRSLTLPTVQAEGFRLISTGTPQTLNGQLGFSGQLAANAITGQFQLNQVSLPQLQQAFNLPIDLAGQVHAIATLSGSPTQPNLIGEVHLDDVTVRDMAIEQAKIGFSYVDRQFHLENWQSLAGMRSNN